MRFATIALSVSLLAVPALGWSCSGGSGEGGRASSIVAGNARVEAAYCSCFDGAQAESCRASLNVDRDALSCEVGVLEREGQASILDCGIDSLNATGACFEAAACDQSALESCIQQGNTCAEVPANVEAAVEMECRSPDVEFPPDAGVPNIGDTVPLSEVCSSFGSTYCQREDECGIGQGYEVCLSSFMLTCCRPEVLACDTSTQILKDVSVCLDAVSTWPCQALEIARSTAECQGLSAPDPL